MKPKNPLGPYSKPVQITEEENDLYHFVDMVGIFTANRNSSEKQ